MATGGLCISSSECSICLESMRSKEPRLLTCGHTFCTSCIEQLAAKNPITCPKCRTETKIPQQGVMKLPKNIEFIAICEALENYSKEQQDQFCGPCLIHHRRVKVTHECDKCPSKLICTSCADKHTRLVPFQSHKVHAIGTKAASLPWTSCFQHKLPLEYFCGICESGLCLYCMYGNDHSDHENKITDFESGVKVFRESLSLNKELGEQRDIIQLKNHRMTEDFNNICKTETKLKQLQTNLEANLHLVNDYLVNVNEIKGNITTEKALLPQLEERSNLLSKQWEHLEKLDHHKFFQEVKTLKAESEEMLNEMKEHSADYNLVIYTPGNIHSALTIGTLQTVPRQIPTVGPDQVVNVSPYKELSLQKPKLVLEIKQGGKVHVSTPREIISVGDGTVIIVCVGLQTLQNIDVTGTVIKEYNIGSNVSSAAVSKGYLYAAVAGNRIIKMALDETDSRMTYRPDSVCVSRIAASEKGIVISEDMYGGSLLEYDLVTTSVLVRGIQKPWFVSSNTVKGKYYYILTVYKTKEFQVYNNNWDLTKTLTTRGTKKYLDITGNALTPGGKILVADWGGKAISEYEPDGTYVRDILSYPDIDQPYGLLYERPYLWVTEGKPSIKVFRVD